jgi:hypothetical protein
MKAIGLGHRTSGLTGLHRTMTANVSMRGIGKETAAVLSTITTRTMIETAILTIMTNMAIMVTVGTTDSHIASESLCGFGDPVDPGQFR